MNESVLSVSEFTETADLSGLELVKRHKGERRKRGQKDYFDIVCAFDIETSTVINPLAAGPDPAVPRVEMEGVHSFMYVWQCQIGENYTIVGRTWGEYTQLLDYLKHFQAEYMKAHKIHVCPHFVFYVHNLAFEWQFLQGIYKFENENCFFRDIRKPIYARYRDLIEYRCSYLHSNMSLAKFGENMGATVRKLDGDEYDYKKIRYPWTPLSEYELNYCVNDVRTLVESLMIEMDRDGDTLLSIPLTSTGYVRRDCKKAIHNQRYSIEQMLPNLDVYNLLRRCFRGGDTHANRYRVGTIQGAGNSVDIESSYPYALCTMQYPMTPFRPLETDDNGAANIERVIRQMSVGKAVIADYHFKGLKLKNPRDPMPYLPVSKCRAHGVIEDNGRILSADLVVTALTEIDLEIVLNQYDYYTVAVYNPYVAQKALLPAAYRKVVCDYYAMKTQLKGVAGREYEYIKSKNKVNSTYGMAAQQNIHPVIVYENGEYLQYMPGDETSEKELKKAPFPYQWGVYCTANARANLRKGMELIPADETGISRIIYCDTDSIKYTGKEINFDKLNLKIRALSKVNGATATDRKGQLHYMGKWDPEKPFKRFITQGAKRYAYEDYNNEMHITVSGVTGATHKHEDGTVTLWKNDELGALENFREGMTWEKAGGTAAEYNDADDFDLIDLDSGNTIHVTPNVSIIDTTYTMTMEPDYTQLIDECALFLRFCRERGRENWK